MSNNNIMDLNSLRESLAVELKKISSGDSTPASANAFANLAGKILSSVKLELEYNKISGTTPNISFIKLQEQQKKLEKDK
jgi:hypothetical protein